MTGQRGKSSANSGVERGAPAGTKPVDPLHAFPLERLLPWLTSNVAGFADAVRASGKAPEQALELFQFAHGQSNPTFTLQISRQQDGAVLVRYVLRKKPAGKLLPSAHAVEREYRIMNALRGTGVPVPRTYALCEDSSVIGTPFFVMAFVTGRLFKDITLPGVSRAHRFAMYSDMCRVLAALHRVDPDAVGLGDFGQRENYLGRQVKRWAGQYVKAQTDELPQMDKLIKALEMRVPAPSDPESQRVSIVHGDFRLDNLMFHPTEPRVIAVLDWELSTLGHPLSDLAYNCMPYRIPAGVSAVYPGLRGARLSLAGIPTETEYVRAYARMVGRCGPITPEQWSFLLSLSFFRSASILQGVYKRSLQGNASQSDQATRFRSIVPQLAQQALDILERHGNDATADEDASKSNSQSLFESVQATQARAALSCFQLSDKFWPLHDRLRQFMDEHIYPNEITFFAQHDQLKRANGGNPWHVPPIMEELKAKAREAGLWNLFFTVNKVHGHSLGAGLTNVEYAPLCELMGRVLHMAPEIFNCSAPDTGNMEVLANYGTPAQKERWLKPLMAGEIRSAFAMTEPAVASSDATNIECSIERDGDNYVINGRKHWTSGAMDPRCRVLIVMGKTDPRAPKHKAQSMILVPMDTPGVQIIRPLHVFGYDDAPHGHAEVLFKDVRVPAENILLGEGRGFEIAQGRLGPGRIHHCMRLIGMAERALELMIRRSMTRTAFGGLLATKGALMKDIADSRIEIDSTRLLCLQAAAMIDSVGAKFAAQQIGMIKVLAPAMALRVIDRAIQAHGAQGVCQDTVLPWLWAGARTLRLADGPDEVHRDNIAKLELLKAKL